MLSNMDHLFCLRIRHVLILVPASLRDLHRHSCRHFHFHFWLSLRRSYLHFVSRVDIIFKSPTVSRARLCAFLLSSILVCFIFSFFFILPPPLSLSLIVSPHFSYLSLQRAFSFLASAAEYARSRQKQRRRLSAFRFSASPSSLQPPRGVPRHDETVPKREREDFLGRAEGDRWAPHREIERSGEKGTRRRNVKFSRAHSERRRLRSCTERFQRPGCRFHWTGKSQFAGSSETRPPTLRGLVKIRQTTTPWFWQKKKKWKRRTKNPLEIFP